MFKAKYAIFISVVLTLVIAAGATFSQTSKRLPTKASLPEQVEQPRLV